MSMTRDHQPATPHNLLSLRERSRPAIANNMATRPLPPSSLKQTPWHAKDRRLLIATNSEPDERLALYSLTGLPLPSDEELKRDRTLGSDEAKAKGREARFRLTIVAAYNYTCALHRLPPDDHH